MKIKLFFIIGLLGSFLASAQNVEFSSLEKLDLPEGQGFFNPVLSPSGEKVALTSSNQQGLAVYHLSNGRFQTISEEAGAGRNVVFSPHGTRVYFTEDVYVENRRQSTLMVYDFSSEKKSEVKENELTELKPYSWWDRLVAWWNESPAGQEKQLNIQALKDGHYDYPYVLSKGRKLIFKDVGGEREIQPLGSVNYLWGGLSPNGEKISAVAISKGAFVCDVAGNGVQEIGEIEAPVWLSNDVIIGMITTDDGHVIQDASLKIIHVDNGSGYTPDNSLELMHPSVSRNKNLIAAHSNDGEIVLIEYRIRD